MATRVELVTEAAKKLQILEAGQTLEAEDQTDIDGRVPGLFAQLAKDEVCIVGDEENIPDEWKDPLAGLLANMSASSYGKPYSADVKLVFEADLRRMNASRPTYEPLQQDFF